MRKINILYVFLLCLLLAGISSTQEAPTSDVNDEQAGDGSSKMEPKSEINWVLIISKYQFEMCAISLFIIYVLNYFTGKKKNMHIAMVWMNHHKAIFDQNFAHVGVSTMSSQQGGALFDQESPYCYKFYATGRINVEFALVSLELKKRQDLLTMVLFNLIWPERDRIRIEIPFDTKTPPPFVFSVVKRRELKNVLSSNDDIKFFGRKMVVDRLSNNFAIMGEHEETKEYLMTDNVINVLNKYEKYIQLIHISDQRILPPYPFAARFELLIPNDYERDFVDFPIIFKMIFYLVDLAINHRLKPQSKAQAEKERVALQEQRFKQTQKERQEEIQKKKAEREKAERERIAKLPKEVRAKLEEKEKKAEAKKKMAKRVVKIT